MTAALPALPGYRSTTRTSTCRAPRHCKEHRPFTAIPGFESPWGRHRIKDIKRSAARVRKNTEKILLPRRDGRSPSVQPLLAAARKALLCSFLTPARVLVAINCASGKTTGGSERAFPGRPDVTACNNPHRERSFPLSSERYVSFQPYWSRN